MKSKEIKKTMTKEQKAILKLIFIMNGLDPVIELEKFEKKLIN